MGLGPQVVDLGWFCFVHNFDQTVAVNQISVVKDHFPLSVGPRVVVQVGDPSRVEGGAPSDDPMHGVTLVKEELRQVGTILTC